ncbi:MAG: hypothetical protein KAT58_08215 [candidate division Zixibacteria bacterium]|nr:hypothetical protein [candidate division Zixibacteria bacterium]
MKRLILISILFLVQVAVAQTGKNEITDFFLNYVELLKNGYYTEALDEWSLYDRTITEQLEITYDKAPLKLEIGSALWEYLDDLKSSKAKLEISSVETNRGYARIEYQVCGDDTIAGVHYLNVESGDKPEVVTPLQVFTENWDEVSGTYFRTIFREQSLMERANIAVTDRFVNRVTKILGLSPEKLTRLESIKVRMFLCQSYGIVEQLAGGTRKEFYQPADAVVSIHFPDYNQIAQFLVTYANDNLPPYTLPIIKEGTAAFLGGCNGRSADVTLSLGKYIYEDEFTKLEDLITVSGFAALENNPDFSYPVAALFCKYLFEKLGSQKYFQLYRELSGSRAEVMAITIAQFQEQVATELGSDWQTVVTDFQEFVSSWTYQQITAGGSDQGELIYESGYAGVLVRVFADDTYYNFIVIADSADFNTAILSRYPGQSSSYESFLFAEQFPGRTYNQQRFGIIFTAVEAGSYNYLTNEITGKYIVDLTGKETLATGKPGEYRFRIQKQLLEGFAKQAKEVRPTR